jgi:hypothetical protein
MELIYTIPSQTLTGQMESSVSISNSDKICHKDTKALSVHEEYLMFLGDFVPSWQVFKLIHY